MYLRLMPAADGFCRLPENIHGDRRTISGLSEPGIKRQAYASAEKAKAAPDAGRLG